MKRVEMYQAVDGQVFHNEKACIDHDQDCIGAEFDALLLEAVQATGGNVARNDQYKMCLHLLKNSDKVLPILKNLVSYIENSTED